MKCKQLKIDKAKVCLMIAAKATNISSKPIVKMILLIKAELLVFYYGNVQG
jgi:hypothetical protein